MGEQCCDNPNCWCCGSPHHCDTPPVGQWLDEWVCPDCGMVWAVIRGEDIPHATSSFKAQMSGRLIWSGRITATSEE